MIKYRIIIHFKNLTDYKNLAITKMKTTAKTILLISLFFIGLSKDMYGNPTIEFWYRNAQNQVEYVDYNTLSYVDNGVTYHNYILEAPVTIVNETYWYLIGSTWNITTEMNWLNQFSAYLWDERTQFGEGNVFALAYTSFNNLGYKRCIEVELNETSLYNRLDKYSLVHFYDTTEVTVDVYDTTTTYIVEYDTVVTDITVYDTVTTYETVTTYDTIQETVYDTTFTDIVTYDTVTTYENIYTTVYDTVYTTIYDTTVVTMHETIYTTETTYDTVTVQEIEYISVMDTLEILLNDLMTSVPGNQKEANETLVKVFPNPATHMIKINSSRQQAVNKAKLYNAAGSFVSETSLWQGFGELEVSTLARGLYFLRLVDEQEAVMTIKKILLR